MGCFNVSCGISNLSINEGDKIKFIPLTVNNPYVDTGDCIILDMNYYYNPTLLPITGYSDGYGRVVDIEKDDNVLAIEKYFKTSIEDFLGTITEYDSGNEYSLSGMYVLDEVYNELVKFSLENSNLYASYVLGENIEKLGFRQISEEEQFFIHPYYKKLYRNEKHGYDLFMSAYGATILPTSEKQYVVVDETDISDIAFKWTKLTKEDISSFPVKDSSLPEKEQFELIKSYLEDKFGYTVGFSKTEKEVSVYSHRQLVEEWLKLTGEHLNLEFLKNLYDTDYELARAIDTIKGLNKIDNTKKFNLMNLFSTATNWIMFYDVYQDKVLEGKLKANIRDFKAFERSMYSCNRHYFPTLNGEQCGNSKASKMLLNVSSKIINERLKN